MDILQTRNPAWGFHGAFNHQDTDPSVAWPLAMEAIAKKTGCPAECIRTFLESPIGRTFAEAVIERMSTTPLETIETAVDAADPAQRAKLQGEIAKAKQHHAFTGRK
jgi:hypothetical protein